MRYGITSIRIWWLLSLSASALYILSGHVVFAKDSAATPAVYGHQIMITSVPTISGNGIVAEPIRLPVVPETFDPDGDELVNWSYQWLYNGKSVAEGTADSVASIPSYIPTIGQEGGTLTLALQAMADPKRSYPDVTKISTVAYSNTIKVQPGTIWFIDSNNGLIIKSQKENASGFYVFDVQIDGTNGDYEWSFGGSDQTMFSWQPTNGIINNNRYQIALSQKDFENPQDKNHDNRYDLDMTVKNTKTGAITTTQLQVTILNEPDAVPVASNLVLTGNTVVGETLIGSFTYSDADGDAPGNHIYQWYRADDQAGQNNRVAIVGATGASYTMAPADQGKFMVFEVIPVSVQQAGYPYKGNAASIVKTTPVLGRAPVATGVNISGAMGVGSMLTANFTYSDADNDLAGTHIYRWYRSDYSNGSGNRVLLANAKTYTLVSADIGKYITLEVTPVSLTGDPNTGATVSYTSNNTVALGVSGVGVFAYGGNVGETTLTGYSDAVALCDNLVAYGYSDWRLASLSEMQSLYKAYPNGAMSTYGWQTINGYYTTTVYSAGMMNILFLQNGALSQAATTGTNSRYGNAGCIR